MEKELAKKWPILASSVNAERISLTVKGILLAIVPVALIVAQIAGLNVAQEDLVDFIESVSAGISIAIIIYGVGRKIAMGLKKF